MDFHSFTHVLMNSPLTKQSMQNHDDLDVTKEESR